jgi:capsular polysaccharide export protein
MTSLPILRSPPFPGITPAVAAVSVPTPHIGAAVPADGSDIVEAIRSARVGGAFWAESPAISTGTALVRVADEADARALPARLADAGPSIVLLPDARWSAKAAAALAARNIAAHVGAVDLWPLLDHASRLEAGGDDEAVLLALIAGVPVHCTKDGRFAGRGLTIDAPNTALRDPLTLASLVERALTEGIRYRDCFTGTSSDAHAAINQLADWRRLIDANRGIAVAAGIAIWKRREVARLLWNGNRRPLRFARTKGRALRLANAAHGRIAAWPSRMPTGLNVAADAAGVQLTLVEDGFIRSVGLGSNLHPPLSIVADNRGIYYDPSRPSDLETLLAEADFTPELRDRAIRLATTIVTSGISKYSSGNETYRLEPLPGRRRVLVAGQVEDDESVRLGGGGVAGNRDLLARARAAEPDAFILFKPHPDVDAGHRAGRIDDAEALRWADRVVRDVPMPALLGVVDGVHVLTSLTGYEALLRGCDVTVHGGPFYAGWGLTRDLGRPLPRRTRRLSLDELTAGALILYPRYLDPVTGLPCPPELLIRRLAAQARPRQTLLIRGRRLQGWLRRALSPIGRAT